MEDLIYCYLLQIIMNYWLIWSLLTWFIIIYYKLSQMID